MRVHDGRGACVRDPLSSTACTRRRRDVRSPAGGSSPIRYFPFPCDESTHAALAPALAGEVGTDSSHVPDTRRPRDRPLPPPPLAGRCRPAQGLFALLNYHSPASCRACASRQALSLHERPGRAKAARAEAGASAPLLLARQADVPPRLQSQCPLHSLASRPSLTAKKSRSQRVS